MEYAKLFIKKPGTDKIHEIKFQTETYVPVIDDKERIVWMNVLDVKVGDIIGKREQFVVVGF